VTSCGDARPCPSTRADYACAMDADRAKELLQRERQRIEDELKLLTDDPLESDERVEPGDLDSEDLYQDEYDDSRREQLNQEMEALERAEARLRDGTYGLSVESGKPIPDARLEARPTAERTIEEEDRYRRGV
jgi:DnaK suppressor protein